MFRDGARPTGNDFADVFDSFVHRTDDGFIISSNGAQINNFTLGNFSAVPVAGSMRFTAGEVQFFDGTIWKNVSSNDLGFKPLNQQPATALPDAAYFGKIGINMGATPPASLTDDFEIGLVVPATAITNKARVGEAVIGGEENGRAIFLNKELKLPTAVNGGDPKLNYAVAQTKPGRVTINTVTGQSIRFCTNDSPQMQFKDGALVVGSINNLAPNPSPPLIDPAAPIMLHVHGHAIKLNGGSAWLVTSDIRTKKNISEFKDGLEKLKAVRPVNFCYNGKGGTKDNQEQIGLIGQEVEEVFPYMVKRMGNTPSVHDEVDYPENMVLLDSSPLLYILVNAIRELDEKIEQLKNN
jgi:hypothetical protein